MISGALAFGWSGALPAVPRFWPAGRAASIAILASLVVGLGCHGLHRRQTYLAGCGPLRVKFLLPQTETGRNQPVLTTGWPAAGAFVFLNFTDAGHVRVGLDVWGRALRVSDPIPVDYLDVQEMVISTSAPYPENHPKLRDRSADDLRRLRQWVKIQFNGRTVIDEELDAFTARLSEITIGETRIGDSSTEPRFKGEILEVERLPVPPQ